MAKKSNQTEGQYGEPNELDTVTDVETVPAQGAEVEVAPDFFGQLEMQPAGVEFWMPKTNGQKLFGRFVGPGEVAFINGQNVGTWRVQQIKQDRSLGPIFEFLNSHKLDKTFGQLREDVCVAIEYLGQEKTASGRTVNRYDIWASDKTYREVMDGARQKNA